jgi:hypothetical protein
MSSDLHRFEARATIKPGECERNLAGQRVQLVRIVLTDDGPVTADGGDGDDGAPTGGVLGANAEGLPLTGFRMLLVLMAGLVLLIFGFALRRAEGGLG